MKSKDTGSADLNNLKNIKSFKFKSLGTGKVKNKNF